MDIESFSDEGTSRQARTSWEIENGPKEVYYLLIVHSGTYVNKKHLVVRANKP